MKKTTLLLDKLPLLEKNDFHSPYSNSKTMANTLHGIYNTIQQDSVLSQQLIDGINDVKRKLTKTHILKSLIMIIRLQNAANMIYLEMGNSRRSFPITKFMHSTIGIRSPYFKGVFNKSGILSPGGRGGFSLYEWTGGEPSLLMAINLWKLGVEVQEEYQSRQLERKNFEAKVVFPPVSLKQTPISQKMAIAHRPVNGPMSNDLLKITKDVARLEKAQKEHDATVKQVYEMTNNIKTLVKDLSTIRESHKIETGMSTVRKSWIAKIFGIPIVSNTTERIVKEE